jgi:hypothetical protein
MRSRRLGFGGEDMLYPWRPRVGCGSWNLALELGGGEGWLRMGKGVHMAVRGGRGIGNGNGNGNGEWDPRGGVCLLHCRFPLHISRP